MSRIVLRTPPDSVDRYGRAIYLDTAATDVRAQTNELIEHAAAEGYTGTVGMALYGAVRTALLGSANPPLDLLEIGGGDGFFFDQVRDLVHSYANVEPADLDLDAAARARLADDRYQCVRCSAERLPFTDGSFDAALAVASLDHVPDVDAALVELARVLRPGGSLIVQLNNRRSWWKVLLSRTSLVRKREAAIAREHYIQWSLGELQARLAAHFEIIHARTITYAPFVPVIWRPLLAIADVVGPLILPGRGANSIVIGRCRAASG